MTENKFKINKKPIPYFIAEDYFDETQINDMLTELRFLTPKMVYQNGKNMVEGHKKNVQIGIDDMYQNRDTSNIIQTLDTIYQDKELIQTLKDMSWFYEIWNYTNLDNTFVAYYENSDYYKGHRDIAVISMMYWIWEEPKSFTGGDIHLTDYDIEIPLKRNQLLIIPSSIKHAVNKIQMNDDIKKLSGMGRYCIARFLKLQ
jgi:hypothetical protein